MPLGVVVSGTKESVRKNLNIYIVQQMIFTSIKLCIYMKGFIGQWREKKTSMNIYISGIDNILA